MHGMDIVYCLDFAFLALSKSACSSEAISDQTGPILLLRQYLCPKHVRQ
jgi:hypothetical protein